MVHSLPLQSGFFATPKISPDEEVELLNWGRSLIQNLYEPEVAEWTNVAERKGLQICEDRQKGGLTYSVKSFASIRASLDDIMDIFMTTTSDEFRTLMQLQLREYYYDSTVLYQKDQNDRESLSIKWFAAKNKKTAMNPIVNHQDFCVMEYAGVLPADVVGGDPSKLIGICLYESIEQAECVSLWDSHRLERGSISKCGYIFRPREEKLVEAQFICSIRQPPNARSKRRLNRSLLVNWAESLACIEEYIGTRRISRELLKRGTSWVPDAERQCCHLCLKTFTHTRRRHHCRACGEVICRNCSSFKSVELQAVGLKTCRICKSCMNGSNSDQQSTSSIVETSSSGKNVDFDDYSLALRSQAISSVPDLVGIAWLRQIAARDPTKRDMIQGLMGQLHIDMHAHVETEMESDQMDIYDTLCDLAAQALSCKYAVVNLIDENRQWFKSAVNVMKSDVPRDFSFCEYPVRERRPMVVMDTLHDARFVDNPFVTGSLQVRFIAGAPLFTVENECVGAVCVLDTEPRQCLEDHQIATMQNLAHLAMVTVQERRMPQSRSWRSSDLVPLHSVHGGTRSLVPTPVAMPATRREDPHLKQQMFQLLQKASQVSDQVTQQSINAQQSGLQSSGESEQYVNRGYGF